MPIIPAAVTPTMFSSVCGASAILAALIAISLDMLKLNPNAFLDSSLNL